MSSLRAAPCCTHPTPLQTATKHTFCTLCRPQAVAANTLSIRTLRESSCQHDVRSRARDAACVPSIVDSSSYQCSVDAACSGRCATDAQLLICTVESKPFNCLCPSRLRPLSACQNNNFYVHCCRRQRRAVLRPQASVRTAAKRDLLTMSTNPCNIHFQSVVRHRTIGDTW
jgi:hypothetical protein